MQAASGEGSWQACPARHLFNRAFTRPVSAPAALPADDLDPRHAGRFRYQDLLLELLPQLRHVGDDADHAAADLQPADRVRDRAQRLGVERAEALVDKE